MKRIFLSLPMSGRSDEEICDQIEEMKARFLLKNPFEKGEEIEFVDNLENDIDPSRCIDVKTEPLLYLGEAIRKLAYCDAAYFGKGWMEARGCIMEWQTCMKYGIPRYIQMSEEEDTEDEKEHNRQLKSKNSGRYPWDKIKNEGYCSVCVIEKGSSTCEKCKHKEEVNG